MNAKDAPVKRLAPGTGVADSPRVAVIIVNWNGKANTLECLGSLKGVDYSNVEVVVVDNGSADGSVEAIRNAFPDVVVLDAKQNLGITGGRNIGIRHALQSEVDFVLFLDNDVVVEPQLIRNLVSEADRSEACILGAKIYYFDEPQKIWYAGGKWQDTGFAHVGMGDIDDGDKYNVLTETDYACGCALFVNREILKSIGLFDDRYFCYFEETDFCYRARAAGFRSFFLPSAHLWHKVSSSSGGERSALFYYFMSRNLLLWSERHLSFGAKLKVYRSVLRSLYRAMRPPAPDSVTPPANDAVHSAVSPKRWVRRYVEAWKKKCADPANTATLLGVRDYLLRRFGNCPESVRSLRKRDSGQNAIVDVGPRVTDR